MTRYPHLHTDAAIGAILLLLLWVFAQVLVGDNSGEPPTPGVPVEVTP